MRVVLLNSNSAIYTCNVYLVLGSWSTLDDINTLVDTGSDSSLLDGIKTVYTGVGKKPVDRVILTHSHFDHTGGLPAVIERYRPQVYAYSAIDMRDNELRDGQYIRMGDSAFEVVHAPMHSNDSVCLYCEKEGVLFSGDTPLNIKSPGGSYHQEFVSLLERLVSMKIDVIYPGHGRPVALNLNEMIRTTLHNVLNSSLEDKRRRS